MAGPRLTIGRLARSALMAASIRPNNRQGGRLFEFRHPTMKNIWVSRGGGGVGTRPRYLIVWGRGGLLVVGGGGGWLGGGAPGGSAKGGSQGGMKGGGGVRHLRAGGYAAQAACASAGCGAVSASHICTVQSPALPPLPSKVRRFVQQQQSANHARTLCTPEYTPVAPQHQTS